MERKCEHCGTTIQRRGVRGRWPKLCTTCRDDPDAQAAVRRQRKDARRAASDARVEALMKRLNRDQQ